MKKLFTTLGLTITAAVSLMSFAMADVASPTRYIASFAPYILVLAVAIIVIVIAVKAIRKKKAAGEHKEDEP